MLKAIEETLAQKARNEELTTPDLGKAEAKTTLRTPIDNTKPPELSTWVKACKHIFAVEGFIACKWKEQDTDGANPRSAKPEEVTAAPDGYQWKRMNIGT